MPTVFDEDRLLKIVEEKKEYSLKPEVYTNPSLSAQVNKDIKVMSSKIEKLHDLRTRLDDINDFVAMCEMEDDESLLSDIKSGLDSLSTQISELYLATLLSGEYDNNDVELKIHSGAGGTEACDWAAMLQRMYQMFAEKNGFKCVVTDKIDGDGAGVKSVTIEITGDNAYGYLKSEMGVHRLVRISPFDSNKRRHTSFASVEVMPKLSQDISIDIRQEDLKIDVYRSGGAGGQHVNTTDSAVRITHLPTGVVAFAQDERSQFRNREIAMSRLIEKLNAYYSLERLHESEKERKEQAKRFKKGHYIRTFDYDRDMVVYKSKEKSLKEFLQGKIND